MAEQDRVEVVAIEGIEKRTNPTKHYVYTIRVEMSDGSIYNIYRRYKEFLKLQTNLCNLFPKESGSFTKVERILPFIPGKAASGKNHIRSTAIERISHLEEFCKQLVQMPDHISQCRHIKEFFAQKAEDDAIVWESDMMSATTNENFTPKSQTTWNQKLPANSLTFRVREAFVPVGKNSESQIPLSQGEIVEVIEKLDTGWWYVEAECGQGWVPASCLEDPNGRYISDTKVYATFGELGGKPYVVTKSYRATASDELSIRRGAIVTILEKKSDGWWLAEYEGVRGMVPGCFLARRSAAKGIRLSRESEAADPTVDQPSSANAIADLTKVNGTAAESPRPKPSPALKSRRPVASPQTSPLSSPHPPPRPSPIPSSAHRPANDFHLPPVKEGSSLESSSDEEETPSAQGRPTPPPPREASLKPTKLIPLSKKISPTTKKKRFIACQDYTSTVLGTINLKKGQKVQVMPRPDNDGWLEIKVNGKKGFAPMVCIEETKKSQRKTTDHQQKCDLQDIEDAYWAGDAIEGERVLHNIGIEGTFMIRQSQSTEKQETLLIYEESKILKYKIQEKQGNQYSLSKSCPIFGSLEELIYYYSANVLPKTTTKLRVPYQRLIST